MGGGRTEEFVRQQVQDFLSVTGGQSILSVNTKTVGKSVDDNERKTGKGHKRSATMLQYASALLRLVLWAVQKSSYYAHKKCSRQHLCQTALQGCQEKRQKRYLCIEIDCWQLLEHFFYIYHGHSMFANASSKPARLQKLKDLLDFRNYHLMSLSLWNGSRPMPLRLVIRRYQTSKHSYCSW